MYTWQKCQIKKMASGQVSMAREATVAELATDLFIPITAHWPLNSDTNSATLPNRSASAAS